jgi:long-chain acyl-CoA synthetase
MVPGVSWNVATDEAIAAGSLARAWSSESSVLLAPARRGVEPSWFQAAIDRLPAAVARDHVAIFTSGSTGEPRLVVGLKARAEALARQIHAAQELEPVERTVTLLPLTYSYAFVNQWAWSHVYGRALVTSPGLADVAATAALLREGPDTMICLVGPMVPLLAAQVAPDQPLASVTRVNFAGGPFPWSERATLARLFPRARVFANYGCTEAMPRLTITPVESLVAPGDLGTPVPGVELRVDERGELVFRSPYGAVGLLDEGRYRDVAPEEWLGTGDLAVADGERLRLVGRKSEVYKRYGEKVSVALQLAAVREVWAGTAAVVPERDSSGEPGHVLVLAPAPADDELRAVLKLFRTRFPRAHWPLRVDSVDTMLLSDHGKPDGDALARQPRRVHWKLPL